nr:MAG TPA: hypothetical protein [Bacteriophage sp.]
MYFKGTIIITDPCYIIKKNPIEHPNEKDFGLPASIISKPFKDYSTPEELAYKAALDYYFSESRKYDDWSKCNYGENMEVLGIHNYITGDTIYGDWSCTTYRITEDPYKVINNFIEAQEKEEDYGINCSKLGDFCADAGLVSVFNLDEVIKYNPNIEEWIVSHDWCVTTIPDFDGEVNYYVDKQDCAHIVGVGNVNFFTDQTGI